MTALQRGDITIGAQFGYYEVITKLALHEQWVLALDDLGNVMRVTGETFSPSGEHFTTLDDPDQGSDYAPHDLVYVPGGLIVLIARLNNTLEAWKYDLDGNVVATFTGLVTDAGWVRTKYCCVDASCDGKTIYYSDRGRTIFRYDVSGAGAQLPNFAQLLVTDPYIYAGFKILKPSEEIVVAMTSYGHGPSNAVCLDADKVSLWTDEIAVTTPAGPYRIWKRSLADGADTGLSYLVAGQPSPDGDQIAITEALACWFNPCGGRPFMWATYVP